MYMNRFLRLVLVLFPLSAQAAEWSAQPGISLRTGYNDNIRLTASPHDTVWEATLSPSIKFAAAQENRGLSGLAGLSVRRFTGGSGRESSTALDREDYRLEFDSWFNTPRNSFRADFDFTRDSTLDTELDDSGNVIDDRATRERTFVSPTWSSMLTELTRLDLSLGYTNVNYSDDIGTLDLVGYAYQSASLSLSHQLGQRIEGTLSAGYSNYLPDTEFDSRTLSLQAGLSTNFSETLQASFLVGQRRTTSDSFVGTGFCLGANPGASFPACTGGIAVPLGTANTEVETDSAVFSASITQTLETRTLSASLTRSSSPSGQGELLDATRLILNGEYTFSERLGSSLRLEYTENETIVSRIGFTPSQDKDTFFRVTPRLTWRWTRAWQVTGEYQYAINDDAGATDKARRNAAYVTLRYSPLKWSVAR